MTTSSSVIPFVDLRRQLATIADEVQLAISGVCQRCDFILGGEVSRFEEAFAKYVGVRHAIGVASGLDALGLALVAAGVQAGEEVLVPANTFIATALAVTSAGARPVLVDCDPRTFNIDPRLMEAAITSKTKALLPVHLTGQPVDMAAIREIATRHGLLIVEDAAQAHGARFENESCGSMGLAGCFSFYPGKNLGAFGDGGAITTNDDQLAERLRRLRNYGQQEKYRHVEQGVNSRLDTIQAAILNVKLPHLDRWNGLRAQHARVYNELLAGVGDIELPQTLPNVTSVHHLYIIQTERRDELAAHLAQRGVQTGIHYPIPIHRQVAYQNLGYRLGDFPVSERLCNRILSLPMFPELELREIQHVVSSIQEWFAK